MIQGSYIFLKLAMDAAGISEGNLKDANWNDVIKQDFRHPDGYTTTLINIHKSWEERPELLACLFQRLAEGRLDSEAEKAFGPCPSDKEARDWAIEGNIYVGHVVNFLNADGNTVTMRVLHIRVILLMYLQKAAINGTLKRPVDASKPMKFRNLMDWKDATNCLKRSLCACCLKFSRDSERFNSACETKGSPPLLWSIGHDMPETKANHNVMNIADSLLREQLREPLVVHDSTGGVFGTYDCSQWQSLIGDAHSNEVF